MKILGVGAVVAVLCAQVLGAQGGETWIQLTPSPDPIYGTPQVMGHSAVYNFVTNKMIVFGGVGPAGGSCPTCGYLPVGDLWMLSNANGLGGAPAWSKVTPLAPSGAPSARELHAAVYDLTNNRMILNGGFTSPGSCSGGVSDTWVLTHADGTGGTPTWLPLSTTGAAPGLLSHGAAYDAAHNRLITHGGNFSACGSAQDGTWVLTYANGLEGAAAWTQLAPTGELPFVLYSLANPTVGFDPGTNSLVSYVKYGAATSVGATRLLSNANGLGGSPAWTDIAQTNPRYAQAGVFDAGRNRMLIFAGIWTVALNDVWRLDKANGQGGTPQWTQINPTGTPPAARIATSTVYDPATGRLIVFGGGTYSQSVVYSDVWVLTGALGSGLAVPALGGLGLLGFALLVLTAGVFVLLR